MNIFDCVVWHILRVEMVSTEDIVMLLSWVVVFVMIMVIPVLMMVVMVIMMFIMVFIIVLTVPIMMVLSGC